MPSLQIHTGEVRLQILDDAGEVRGIFKFNPTDIETAKRLLKIQEDFENKEAEFQKRADDIEKNGSTSDKIDLLSELCQYIEQEIDECFGEGSSKILFGDAMSIDMFNDFFSGITPYYEKASKDRIAKYQKKNQTKRKSISVTKSVKSD